MTSGDFLSSRRTASPWPHYDAAVLGLRNYWYPVVWSREVASRAVPVTLLGERVILFRDRGRVYALEDRCPHRGVPLSYGSQEFPGTFSCCYHGWTFDLGTGALVAAITDGPDSPITGKVCVKTYPVRERLGLVWVYVGDIEPPALEEDLPEELLEEGLTVVGTIAIRPGDWRNAAENGFDEGHFKYLHRNTPWAYFRTMPVWAKTRIVPSEDGKWITRLQSEVHFTSNFHGLGEWPRLGPLRRLGKSVWKKLTQNRHGGIRGISIRLPGVLQVTYPEMSHYEWYMPVTANDYRWVQMLVTRRSGTSAALFKMWYWVYVRWVFHGMFGNQDAFIVRVMSAPPERLYRPDASIIGWRRMCERSPRTGATGAATETRNPLSAPLGEGEPESSLHSPGVSR